MTEAVLAPAVSALHDAMASASEAAPVDNVYNSRLDQCITTAIAQTPSIAFLDLVRRCEGAYPGLVAQVLARRGLEAKARDTHECLSAVSRTPELSPVRSEWYFTQDTASAFLDLIGDPVLAIGTPTVAETASLAERSVTLVDNSPWIAHRCQLKRSTWLNIDFARFTPKENYANIVLDPPWYFPELTTWLDKALRLVPIGGQVLMPLLGELTRPTALAERSSMIEFAQSYGNVRIIPRVVEYDTPLYEQEALRSSGISLTCSCPWRFADLLIVTRDSRKMPDTLQITKSTPPLEWLEFVVGNQLISLRRESLFRSSHSPTGYGPFMPVPGVSGWVLDSVSARDERRNNIDIWTSRNRVAVLTHPIKTAEVLQNLVEIQGIRSSVPKSDSPYAQEVLSWLDG